MHLLIIDNKKNVIGEIKTKPDPLIENDFINAIAKAFSVPITHIITRDQYDRDHGIYRCTICRENSVDAENGFDTCEICQPR